MELPFPSFRDARQHGIVQKWGKDYNGRGTFLAATGFGKTRTMILAAKKTLGSNQDRTCIVIVPTLYLKEQWEMELLKHNVPNTKVYVINTAVTLTLKCSLLILDEIHLYNSKVFGNIFTTVKYTWVIGATATLDESKEFILQRYAPVFERISLEECLHNGWVSDFVIYNLGIELADEDKETYETLTTKFNKHFSFFQHDLKIAMDCMNVEEFRSAYSISTGIPSKVLLIHAIQFMRVMRERKEFIYEYAGKLAVVKELIARFPERRIITFSQTINFADLITSNLGDISISYHSKIGAKLKREALRRFRDVNNKVRVINTAKSFDLGVDFPFVDMSVVLASNSTTTQALQRVGRIIRAEDQKRAIEVNIYIKDTQEERWVRRKQKESVNVYYVDSIEEIE